MNLREPKKKKGSKAVYKSSIPITLNKGEWIVYTAHLTDSGSCINNPDEIAAVHSMGFFGKGSLSRGYPTFGKARYNAPPIIRDRQWVRRQAWLQEIKLLSSSADTPNEFEDAEEKKEEPSNNEKKSEESDMMDIDANVSNSTTNEDNNKQIFNDNEVCEIVPSSSEEDICIIVNKESDKDIDKTVSKESDETISKDESIDLDNSDNSVTTNTLNDSDKSDVQQQLLVLPDSDSETENYLENVKPRIEMESFPVMESLHMSYEETFFLMFALDCLQVIHFDGSLMDIHSAWLYFCEEDKNFIQKYVAYHYFRSKGWVVKSGLKYGGDFLLYKQGPSFYHASYIVIIDVVDADSLITIPSKSSRKTSWGNLIGLDRLSECAAKEILFAQVLWPSSISLNSGPSNPHMLSEFTVRELLWRRWNPKQSQDVMIVEEEEDEDSC
ncbi:PREDICTED: tRNA-splicing endonuclease subunit Sen2 [Polistes dominula]|uniref:tRNA-splicing endonuclease subunit Sen2 n=1 Tax=Polistes dominula TaxID=743375 RepID=A0ABM1JFK8_POLDO|nr:PREDICTED: tRNA-splicing endonuclease subunit Sen2 [Polistes dominula]XP_015191247.1 PREDICTED: tRNA-splicing endonuclease subunit Sen2 [Polistes dominula]